MILIQSQNFDLSTNAIIEWLLSLQTPFIRVNKENDAVELREFSISHEGKIKIVLLINQKEIDLDKITAYWQRRGSLQIRNNYAVLNVLKGEFSKRINIEIEKNFDAQFQTLNSYINKKLADINIKIGNSKLSVLNKLAVLDEASKVGLKIPYTIITTEKRVLSELIRRKGGVITKSIQDSIFIPDEVEHVGHYTEKIDVDNLEEISETFAPSLFQEMLDKQLELRIFFLKDKCYSMAIFSQNDEQTEVDFRKYNNKKPNRTVPYHISPDVSKKLSLLMLKLGLDTGSIDMVVTRENTLVFLEVNPVGQFGMVSYPCNYYIERDIANYLNQTQN